MFCHFFRIRGHRHYIFCAATIGINIGLVATYMNFLPSEIIAHIGTFIKNTNDRKHAFLASKNFSHLLYHNIRHIVPVIPDKDNEYFERMAHVLKKRKPNLRTIVFTFEHDVVDVANKVNCFRTAFPRVKLEAFISQCEQPDDIVQALPDDTLITHFINAFSIVDIDTNKLANKRFKIFNISVVKNPAPFLESKELLDRIETLILSNTSGYPVDLSKVDTSRTISIILEWSYIPMPQTKYVDLHKVTELRPRGSFENILKVIEFQPMFKPRSRMKQVSLQIRDCDSLDSLITLFKYFPKSTRILTIVYSPHDIYALDKIASHGIKVVLWAKKAEHHQCAQAINFITGHIRRYEIVCDDCLARNTYYYTTPQELYDDFVSAEQRQKWALLKYLHNK